tara:strand:+ start:535 stop:1875 length:1341 start_codon:yes stop_codon:yes gene_type:complete
MATTELKRTISSAGSQTKWGASAWVKLGGVGTSISQPVYCSSKSDTTANLRGIFITSDDKIQVGYYDGSYSFQVETNRLLKDPCAFYHLCIEFDSSQSTANDRIKIWVNGVQETSMATNSQPSQNGTYNFFGTDITQLVGSLREGSTICNPCIISHLHVTDGYCYPASSYGETDTDTGEWKIKTAPSVSYGTNGFFVLKNDAALTDRSGQGNNLTLGSGTLTKSEDNPDNNYCVLNTNMPMAGDCSFENANNSFKCSTSNWRMFMGSLGITKGKYYWEFKPTVHSGGDFPQIGIISPDAFDADDYIGNKSSGYAYMHDGRKNVPAGASTYGNTWAANDIISVAFDMDNLKLYFGKNGTWQNSGDPTSGSTGTGAISVSSSFSCYVPGGSVYEAGSGGAPIYQFNFGNGYFGSTAVSSAGTNASGNGIFEYDVPANFTALCTKGLNT